MMPNRDRDCAPSPTSLLILNNRTNKHFVCVMAQEFSRLPSGDSGANPTGYQLHEVGPLAANGRAGTQIQCRVKIEIAALLGGITPMHPLAVEIGLEREGGAIGKSPPGVYSTEMVRCRRFRHPGAIPPMHAPPFTKRRGRGGEEHSDRDQLSASPIGSSRRFDPVTPPDVAAALQQLRVHRLGRYPTFSGKVASSLISISSPHS